MYRDFRKGAPVEADAILGDLIERAEKHNISAPLLQAVFVSLSMYQRELDRGKASAA
jgi:2-dehydropantoate 2-reductase